MSQQYPAGSYKNCATCAFWTGSRDTNTFGEYASVSSPMAKGSCASPKSGSKGSEKQANGSCPAWQKWPVLK